MEVVYCRQYWSWLGIKPRSPLQESYHWTTKISVDTVNTVPMNKNQIAYNVGAQPEIFQGRGGFLKLGYFNKHFLKKSRKKAPQQKILELLVRNTLKTIFWTENLTSGWTKLEPFFPKPGNFFLFLKKGRGGFPPLP